MHNHAAVALFVHKKVKSWIIRHSVAVLWFGSSSENKNAMAMHNKMLRCGGCKTSSFEATNWMQYTTY